LFAASCMVVSGEAWDWPPLTRIKTCLFGGPVHHRAARRTGCNIKKAWVRAGRASPSKS
jgi:hypothetical protein